MESASGAVARDTTAKGRFFERLIGALKNVPAGHDRFVVSVGALLCLVPLLWFGSGEIVQGADYNNPINPGREIDQILSGWQPDNLGEPTFRQAPRLFPYLTFWKTGEAIGLSPGGIQRAWFVTLFVVSFVSAWTLVKALVPSRERRGWPALVAVAVYVFNPFTVSSWAIGHNVQFLAYAIAPLWLVVLHRTLKRPASLVSGIPLGLLSLVFASTAHNPPMILTMIIVTSLLLILIVALLREVRVRDVLVRVGATLPWLLLINAWWVIPFLSAAIDGTGYAYPGRSVDLLSYPSLTIQINFSEFIRGLGYWGEYASYNGVDYLPWASSFSNSFLIAATLWLVALAFVPLLMRRRIGGVALFPAALALVGIFVSKGVNPPFSDINRWLYLNAPGFYLLRGTYEKAAGLIFLAVFIGCVVVLTRSRHKYRRIILASVTGVAAGAAAWPMFTGAVMPALNANGVASVVRIPDYYDDLLEWTEQTPDVGTLLTVPQGPLGYIKTRWAYAGPDPIYNYSQLPIVTGAPDARRSDGTRFAAFLKAARRFDDAAYLRSLGITHVIARMDVDPFFYAGTRRPKRVDGLLRKNHFELVQVLGSLRMYAVPLTDKNVPRNDKEVDLRIETGGGPPYTGRFENLDGRALVVLPQSFDENWTLEVSGPGSGDVAVVEHMPINRYANGWVVEGTGDINLQATYRPAVPVPLGIGLSGLTVMVGIALIIRRRAVLRSRSRDPEGR